MYQTITSNWRPKLISRISFSRKDQALAACARRDGRMMAASLKNAGARNSLHEFHARFSEMATRYSEAGFPEFESTFYRSIK